MNNQSYIFASPSVSVVMGTYNGGKYIREQLNSILGQTRIPSELVVSDDGSTDDTLSIVEDFARNAPFKTVVHKNFDRLGFRANFVNAMGLAGSELISFCDQDDIWMPNKLEATTAFFSDPDMMMVHHNAILISANGDDLGNLIWPQPKQEPIAMRMALPPWFNVPGLTQLFRREIASTAFAWPSSISPETANQTLVHDQWVTFISNSLGKVGYINEPLAKYRQHGQNAIGWYSGEHSFLRKLQYWLETRTEVFQRLEQSAAQKSSALASVCEVLPEGRQDSALMASDRWGQLARAYRERYLLYSGGLLRRTRALAYLVSTGAYSERGFWTFSKKGLIKDAILGAVLGPITVRYGFKPSGGDASCRRGRESQ
jgi:glycosyltransferase involved in cell wall biosynthesis